MRRLLLLLAVVLTGCPVQESCTEECIGSNGGTCFLCPGPYTCNSGGSCGPASDGVACCTGVALGTGGCCAAWNCNGENNCQLVMGADTGTQCGFADSPFCASWCTTYIPGVCTCSC